MTEDRPAFRCGAFRPIKCLQNGWRLIRGGYWLIFGITAVGMLVGSLGPMGILMGPAMC